MEPHEEERALVEAVRRGDPDAFERLVRRFRPLVYGVCHRFTANEADADDLAQEIFLRLYRGLDGFRGTSRLSTWLYRIAVNAALSWAERRPARREDPLPDELVDAAPGPYERTRRDEAAAAVRAAVAKLPAKQRITLVLRVYEELSHREIAAILGSPVGTVKANFFFALRNLRKILDEARVGGGADLESGVES